MYRFIHIDMHMNSWYFWVKSYHHKKHRQFFPFSGPWPNGSNGSAPITATEDWYPCEKRLKENRWKLRGGFPKVGKDGKTLIHANLVAIYSCFLAEVLGVLIWRRKVVWVWANLKTFVCVNVEGKNTPPPPPTKKIKTKNMEHRGCVSFWC